MDFENHPDIAGLHQGYFFANHQLQEDLKDGLLTTFPGWGKVYPPARLSSPLVALTSDEVYDFFEFDMNKIINEIGVPVYGDHYHQEQFDRYYLLTHGDDFPNQYSVLPIPWVLTDFSGEQATVESLILRTGAKANDLDGLDQGFRMSVVLQERSLEP